MPKILIFALFSLVFLVFASVGNAAMIDQAGAEHLKQLFEKGIAQYQENTADQYGHMNFDGDVAVETADNYYAVTLPFMTWQREGWPDIKIGIIAVNVTPHADKGKWNMAVALPIPIYAVDLQENINARLDIKQQSFTGTWNESISGFENLKALYKDITLTNHDNIITFRLPELAVEFNNKKKKSGREATSMADIFLKNLEYIDPQNSIFQFGLWHTKVEIQDAPENWLKESFYAPLMNSENKFLYLFEQPPAGINLTTEIENMNLYTQGEKEKTASLEKLSFVSQASDLKSDNAKLTANLKYNELVSPFPVTALDITDIDADLNISNIPLSQITTLLKNIKGQQIAGLSMMLRIPALLSQAGTTMTFNNPLLKGPDYESGINTEIKADLTALNSVTVKGDAHIRGIDEFTQRIAAYGNFFETLMEGVKKLSNKEKVPKDQTPTHYLNFSMDGAGKILINNKDIFAEPEPEPKPETEQEAKEKKEEKEEGASEKSST